MRKSGGETGIRTLGTREGSTVFETAPFDHSGTSPRRYGVAAFKGVIEGVQERFHSSFKKVGFPLSVPRNRLGIDV
jgi:hypothetical protein